MEADTGLVIDATRKASRYLQRDYFELENLQSSGKGLDLFCKKSCGKALQTLHENLSKYFKTIIFNSSEVAKSNFTGKAALIETLDGLPNLERSLPFFAIMVTIISKKDGVVTVEKSIMNFPAFGEIYYSEKGKGSWVERHSSNLSGGSRVRMSGIADLNSAIVSIGKNYLGLSEKLSSNIRIYESYTYSLTLLISGKIDAMIVDSRDISSGGVELFVKEAGGSFYNKNGLLLASNFKLHDKIKSIL